MTLNDLPQVPAAVGLTQDDLISLFLRSEILYVLQLSENPQTRFFRRTDFPLVAGSGSSADLMLINGQYPSKS
jgi:hypothetical protein